jgi:hypothetical protein
VICSAALHPDYVWKRKVDILLSAPSCPAYSRLTNFHCLYPHPIYTAAHVSAGVFRSLRPLWVRLRDGLALALCAACHQAAGLSAPVGLLALPLELKESVLRSLEVGNMGLCGQLQPACGPANLKGCAALPGLHRLNFLHNCDRSGSTLCGMVCFSSSSTDLSFKLHLISSLFLIACS